MEKNEFWEKLLDQSCCFLKAAETGEVTTNFNNSADLVEGPREMYSNKIVRKVENREV